MSQLILVRANTDSLMVDLTLGDRNTKAPVVGEVITIRTCTLN